MPVRSADSPIENVMSSLLLDDRFAGLSQGDHICAIYADPVEQAAAMVRYIRSGIESSERAVYIADDRSSVDVRERLEADGLDVGAAEGAGRLQLLTKRESYLRDGEFVPSAMIDFLRHAERDALESGCLGLRVTGEMTWALGAEVGSDCLLEYEAALNRFFPGSRSQGICQYNRARFRLQSFAAYSAPIPSPSSVSRSVPILSMNRRTSLTRQIRMLHAWNG